MFVTGSVMNSTTVSYLTSRGKVYVKTATYSDRLVYKINISKSTTYIVTVFFLRHPRSSPPLHLRIEKKEKIGHKEQANN